MSDLYANAERELRERLAALLREYQERAKPIIEELAHIESLKPPKAIFIQTSYLSPAMLEEVMRCQLPKLTEPQQRAIGMRPELCADYGMDPDTAIAADDNARAWPKADNE